MIMKFIKPILISVLFIAVCPSLVLNTSATSSSDGDDHKQSPTSEYHGVLYTRPKLVEITAPPIWAEYERQDIVGTVIVSFALLEDGNVTRAYIIETPNEELAKATIAAIKKWKFVPGKVGGYNAPFRVYIKVSFPFDTETVVLWTPPLFNEKLPYGYRLPQQSDYPEYYQSYFKNNFPFKIDADFDGNGKADTALLLIKSDNSGWSLFVFLTPEQDQIHQLKLDDTQQTVKYLLMGILGLEPGEYKTACGKGYWDCKNGEPEKLILKSPGIDYFRFESGNSVFYWNKDSKYFSRIWLSD